MSLIMDAIKRAERLRPKEPGQPPFFPETPPKQIKRRRERKSLFVLSGVGLAILLGAFYFLNPFPTSKSFLPNQADQLPSGLNSPAPQEVESVFQDLGTSASQQSNGPPRPTRLAAKRHLASQISTREDQGPSVLPDILPDREADLSSPQPMKTPEEKPEETTSLPETRVLEKNEALERIPLASIAAAPSEARAHPLPEPADTDQAQDKQRSISQEVILQFNLGVDLQNRGELVKALQAYQRVIDLDPTYVEAYNNLGILYLEIGELERALELYRKSIEINPYYEKAHNNVGIVHYTKKQYQESREAFEKALALNPNNPETLLNLGTLFKAQGQLEKAIEYTERALRINPLNGETHYNLGLLYEETKELDRAIDHYRKFIRLSRSSHPDLVGKVRRHLEYLMATRRNESK